MTRRITALFCTVIFALSPCKLSADDMIQDSASEVKYPYKTYDNSSFIDEIMRPDIEYPADSNVIDEATISAAQIVSMNDLSGSYFHYDTEETKSRAWSGAITSAYTIVDWRGFNSTIKDNIYDVFRVADNSNGYLVQNSQFDADMETKRAINILGNKAFIPENIDMDAGCAYINGITLDTIVNKTEALAVIYKAVGVECFMPPLISYGNLDGQVISSDESGKKEIKYTSLASLEEASRYVYYAVAARNARNYVYQSSNLVEGYIWQALQDGVISIDNLTENTLKFLKKYQKGEFSQPVSKVKKLYSIDEQNKPDSSNRFSLAYLVGINENNKDNSSSIGHLISRYQQPIAFKNESISLIDFCVLIAQIMHIQGEPVLTEAEQKMLTAAYSSSLPSSMSAEYYESILYLVARGIIDDSYKPEKLYQPLTWKDVYILSSRVADKDSRLTYKTVTIPYDLQMVEDGFIAATPLKSELKPTFIESNLTEGTYKDIFIKKDEYTTFLDSKGKETDPYITKVFNAKTPSYGVLMQNDFKDNYYWFRIYNSIPVPSCYKAIYDNEYNNKYKEDIITLPTTKQEVHCYAIKSNDSSKTLYIENNSVENGIYEFYSNDGICKYNGYMVEPSELKTLSGVDEILLTAAEEPVVNEQENILFTFKLRKNVDLDNIFINGLSKNQWIETSGLSSKSELETANGENKCKAVWVDYSSDNANTIFALYVEGNTPDNYEAIISSKIQYISANTQNNHLAYIKRNSTRDIYYSIGFLQSELGAVLYKSEDGKGYTLMMPDEKIAIEYKNTGGWICYSGNSILKFNSAIPAIKEMNREDTTDRYLVHGLLVEHYLRCNAERGWSAFLGTDGYLHISSALNGADMTFRKTNAGVYNFLTPLNSIDYVSGSGANNCLFEYEGKGSYWLDVRNVPAPLSNYIVFWEIGGTAEARAGLISFLPKLSSDISTDTSILRNLLSLSSAKITQTDNWGLEYISAMKFGIDYASGTDDTTVINGWTLSNLLRYDDKTFSLFYQVPTTDEINLQDDFLSLYTYVSSFSGSIKWRLPYVYEKDIDYVWFMNLPLDKNMKAYKKDINIASNKLQSASRNDSWVNKVIDICGDEDGHYQKKDRKWYPVMPLSDLFTSEISKDKSFELLSFSEFYSRYSGNSSTENAAMIVGPYQLSISSLKTDRVELVLNDSESGLPKWACDIYSSNTENNSISTKAKAYLTKVGNTDLFLPAKSTLTFTKNKDANFESLNVTAVKLGTSFVNSLKDIINAIYLEEKELNERFKSANSILALIYLFAVAFIPRILFGSLFIFQILSLLVNIKFVRLFCDKVFDVYRFVTFGRLSYLQINPVRLWITGTIGSILIILISRDYGSYIIAKIISVVLHIFGSW